MEQKKKIQWNWDVLSWLACVMLTIVIVSFVQKNWWNTPNKSTKKDSSQTIPSSKRHTPLLKKGTISMKRGEVYWYYRDTEHSQYFIPLSQNTIHLRFQMEGIGEPWENITTKNGEKVSVDFMGTSPSKFGGWQMITCVDGIDEVLVEW